MRILVLGGTGSIGSPVLREAAARGHQVTALVRSDAAAAKAMRLGAATLVRGDIQAPEDWVARLPALDAVIHMACDFDSAMAAIDRHLLDVLLARLAPSRRGLRFLYTGGCWLFGDTGGAIATERTAMSPLPAFAWMVPHARRILDDGAIEGIVIHPAMVHGGMDGGGRDGGVFARFARDAVERPAIRVVGGEAVRWPLVHRDDLARLYVLALELAPAGASYIGAAVEGFPVGRIARAFARRFGTPQTRPEIVAVDAIAAELGGWARGYALDQRLSGATAREQLGWAPVHVDPEDEIARFPGGSSPSRR